MTDTTRSSFLTAVTERYLLPQYRNQNAGWEPAIWGDTANRAGISTRVFKDNLRDYPNRAGFASTILAEAHALDVLHDAYKLNESRGTFEAARHFVLDHADPYTHIDAMIHEEFPGAIPDAKLGKLRALAQERLDLKAEIESYRSALQEANAKADAAYSEPITDGRDPRIEGLMRRAAEVATFEEYCEVYDNIATQVGFPTRNDLGMSKRDYSVTVTRVMSLTPTEASYLGVQDVISNMGACSLDYEELEY